MGKVKKSGRLLGLRGSLKFLEIKQRGKEVKLIINVAFNLKIFQKTIYKAKKAKEYI